LGAVLLARQGKTGKKPATLEKWQQGTACAITSSCIKGVLPMSKLVRIVIQLPPELKEQLDRLKQQGYTTSGFIRAMLERELNTVESRTQPTMRRVVNK
jgi:hypothetical protein